MTHVAYYDKDLGALRYLISVVGPDRVLFGTDWPFVGSNLAVGIERVRICIEAGTLNSADADLILGKNAAQLLGIAEA